MVNDSNFGLDFFTLCRLPHEYMFWAPALLILATVHTLGCAQCAVLYSLTVTAV